MHDLQENLGVKVGISACLLGQNVRFDGSHKRNAFVVNHLANHFRWVSVCPEAEAGMGIPRPTIRLVNEQGDLRVIRSDGQDMTDVMHEQSEKSMRSLLDQKIRGFILKKDSPSCGMERVRVYTKNSPTRNGTGVFAAKLIETLPNLPVEEEGRLNDPRLRENFLARVFTYDRWRTYVETDGSTQGLRGFHARHKLLIRAHHRDGCRSLGRLVAGVDESSVLAVQQEYENILMDTLKRPVRSGAMADVLLRVLAFLKPELNPMDLDDIRQAIADYRAGYVPVIVPVTLVRHHVRRTDASWLNQQVYWNPYPASLALRSRL